MNFNLRFFPILIKIRRQEMLLTISVQPIFKIYCMFDNP